MWTVENDCMEMEMERSGTARLRDVKFGREHAPHDVGQTRDEASALQCPGI